MSESSRMGRGERVLATASVVLSLVFVGYEIRQNTKVATAEAIQATASQTNEVLAYLLENPDLADAVFQLAQGATPEDFAEAQNGQLFVFLSMMLNLTESRFRQGQLGVIPGEQWFGDSRAIYESAYVQRTWPALSQNQSADFAEYMSSEFGLVR